MSIESLIQIIVVISLLLGMDFLLLRYRRNSSLKNLFPYWGNRLQSLKRPGLNLPHFHWPDWFKRRFTRSSVQRPDPGPETGPTHSHAAAESVPAAVPTPKTEAADSAQEAEKIISEVTVHETEQQPEGANLIRININAEVPADTVIHITIVTNKQGGASVRQTAAPKWTPLPQLALPAWSEAIFSRLRAALGAIALSPQGLAGWLFGLAVLLYLVTRLIGLTDYPIYFFGDEAVQSVSAEGLLQRGMRGPAGELLPTYFQNGAYYNLSVSVYLQVLPLLFFENSIFVTRATSVVVTLLAAFAVGLMLRNAFQVRHWWLATLLLSLAPAWFLHSRTAFETALFVSFYAGFLYFYLEYRLRNPNNVYWAALMAGLAFYSYSPGQLVLATTGIFLFFNDLQYHWKQRLTLLKSLGLVALLAIPYARFRLTYEYSPLDHLRQLGSYWIQPYSLTEKIIFFLEQYLYGLSPQYWFSPYGHDLVRHQMQGYGNLPLWMFPFLLIGVGIALYHFRSPAHRVLLLAGLAAPAGAALAQIGITRVLVFVIPATLLAALGLNFVLELIENWLAKRQGGLASKLASTGLLPLAVFVLLGAANLAMLTDALRNGPTWYTDYGLYGMQYGAKQVYEETVVPALKSDPEAYFVVTPSWANGAEQFMMFFVPPELRPRMMVGQVYNILDRNPPPNDKTYFVVTEEEFEKIISDPKFKEVTVRSILPYPDGRPGFRVINIKFADNIDELLAAEIEERSKPVESLLEWQGQPVRIVHSRLGSDALRHILDGDPGTLVRGEQANPIVFEFFFEKPIPTSQLELVTGSMANFDVVVQVYAPGSEVPIEYRENFVNLPADPTVNIPFANGPAESNHVIVSIRDNNQGPVANVHVREITFK